MELIRADTTISVGLGYSLLQKLIVPGQGKTFEMKFYQHPGNAAIR
ncbi:hypothetical protein [Maribellus sediminis]|nr:hypothetical protein [Maribellus sediminis]